MKKIVSVILTVMLLLSVVSAAELPAFFTDVMTNYTADYSVSMEIENADEIIALLRELEMPKEVENYIDIKAILESIFSTGMKMNLQADMSPDFRIAKLAVTSDTQYEVVVNSNLEIGAKAKLGMWMELNLNAEKPVFRVIYSAPMLNKYMVVDLFELTPDDESKTAMLEYLNLMFSKDFMDSMIAFTSELYKKYSEITMSGTICTVRITNDGLIGMTKELMPFVMEKVAELTSSLENEELREAFNTPEFGEEELAILDGLKLLGENGITYKYSLISGRVSRADMAADISIDIAAMYSSFTGGAEWPYESNGKIDMNAKTAVKLSKYGATAVKFPELTKNNSFNPVDSLAMAEEANTVEYVPEYPYFCIWVNTNELPVINGEYYVPFRACLENAYEETVVISYNNGVVTATSENFPGFNTIRLTKDSAVAYTDGKQVAVSKVIIKDGTTYVGRSFFEKIYGWELSSIMHYMLENEYEISFYTESY